MKNVMHLAVWTVAVAGLVGCGGSSGAKLGGGKEGAAQALATMSSPAQSAGGHALTLAAQGATSTSLSVDCPKGGHVSLDLDTSGVVNGGATGSISYKVHYDACNVEGKNTFNGDMAFTFKMNLSTDGTSGTMDMTFKGSVAISGEIDDHLNANVTESVAFSGTTQQTANVSVKLNGTISTDSGSYTYNNETFSVNVNGGLTKA